MTTVRHVEKVCKSREWTRLVREMLQVRPENSLRLESDLHAPVAALALALIRLEELGQSHVPLYGPLLRKLIRGQEADGGWSDPLTTALGVRALLADRGHGLAIERGLSYLAMLQGDEGIWPKIPLRRAAADAFTSAYVLDQLGGCARFRSAVNYDQAIGWFRRHQGSLDPEARRLWDFARLRCLHGSEAAPLWS